MICDVHEKARMILDCVSEKGRTVKRIVLMEAFDSELVTRGQDCGIEILSLKEFEVRITTHLSVLLSTGHVLNHQLMFRKMSCG